MSDGAHGYTDEEVEAIFHRALERQQADGKGFHREELVAAAREMGLDEAALDRAAREVERERSEEELRLSVERKKRERWLRHLVTYLVITGSFLGLHLLGLVGTWVFWMAFGWGAGVALHTFDMLRGPGEEEIDKARRRRNRKERRAAKARARAERRRQQATMRRRRYERKARPPSQVSDELDRVIEEGVSLLLGLAAQKLREANERLADEPRPKTEFDRYVAQQKSGRTIRDEGRGRAGASSLRERERPGPARVRMAAEELAAEDEDAIEDAEYETVRHRRGKQRHRR